MIKKHGIDFFVACLAIFIYQNALGPLFSTLLTGLWQSWIGAPSFIGIGVGLLLGHKLRLQQSRPLYGYLYLSFFLVFLLLRGFEIFFDRQMLQEASSHPPHIIETLISNRIKGFVWPLVILTGLPFLFFGAIYSIQLNQKTGMKSYRLELLGIGLGAALCFFLLEGWSLQFVLNTILGLGLISYFLSSSYCTEHTKVQKLIYLVAPIPLLAGLVFKDELNFQRNLHLVSRDFGQRLDITHIETRWKSFAKTQLLQLNYRDRNTKIIAIGDGTGIAAIYDFDSAFSSVPSLISARLAAFNHPKNALVLFAGAGADLLSIHKVLGQQVESIGVEINSELFALYQRHSSAKSLEFWRQFQSKIIIEDNRKFLSRDGVFDSILFSWSGATVANFSGAHLHTTQYSFTEESIESAINHLSPTGIMTVFGGNKLNIIRIIKELEQERVVSDVKNKIVLLDQMSPQNWKDTWDNFILIFKNSPWSHDEIQKLTATAGPHYPLVISPSISASAHLKAVESLVATDKPAEMSLLILQDEGILPQVATDDHPYIYKNSKPLILFDRQPIKESITKLMNEITESKSLWIFVFVFLVGLTTSVTIKNSLRPIFVGTPSNIQFLAWAPVSAAVSLWLLFKGLLYIGNPTLTFVILQVGIQIGNIVGTTLSFRMKQKVAEGIMIFSLILFIVIVFLEPISQFKTYLLTSPIFMLSSVLFVLSLTLSLGLSTYFLKPLMQNQSEFQFVKKLPEIWALETMLSGVCSVAAVFLVEEGSLRVMVAILIAMSLSMILFAKLPPKNCLIMRFFKNFQRKTSHSAEHQRK